MKLRLLAAVALLTPALAFAAPTSQRPEVGGFLGYETDDVSGFAMRLDAEFPIQALNPQVSLSGVGSFGYSHLTKSDTAGGLTGDFTANVFKFVPAARINITLNPQFSLFGDLGLGLALVDADLDIKDQFSGVKLQSSSDHTTNFMMRIGAGAWYHASQQLKLGMMLEFDPIFGDFGFSGASSQTTFNVLFGAMFRI